MPQDDATFGRAGLPTASGGDGLILKIATWQQRGDTARVTGFIRGTEQATLADVKALRDQMQGYDLNPDEPVIPVTCEADPSRDGFYSVESVEVSTDVAGRMRSNADEKEIVYRWEADLTRVPGWQAPLFEVQCTGALRANAHSVTTAANPWAAIPGAAVATDFTASASEATTGATGTSSGAVTTLIDSSGDDFYTGYVTYSVPAADYYDAGCLVEFSPDGGTTWRTVVGRQILNDADGWRISNGRARVSISSGDPVAEVWDGSTWESTGFEIGYDGSGAWTPNTVTVLRNAPEAVGVRVHLTHATGRGMSQDFWVRRGATWIEGFARARDSDNWSLFRSASENGANITGGVEAAAANAAGNKYVMLTPVAKTNDISGVSGFDLNAAATTFKFAFSATNVGVDGAAATSNYYFAAMNHRQQVVAR